MYKKIILSIIIYSINFISIHADFEKYTEYKENSEGYMLIDKIHGENKVLRVYEDIYVNPFSGKEITKNITYLNDGVTISSINYKIGEQNFDYYHNLRKNKNDYIGTGEILDLGNGNKIFTRIQYLENTYEDYKQIYNEEKGYWYSKNYEPKQKVKIRKFYELTFSYDKTSPICGDIKYYNDYNLTNQYKDFRKNTWLNYPIYYSIGCNDTEEGIECVCKEDDKNCLKKENNIIYKGEIGHRSKPTITIKNTVNLGTKCQGRFPEEIPNGFLFDTNCPNIELSLGSFSNKETMAKSGNIDFDTNDIDNRIYETDKNGNKKDGKEIIGKNYFSLKGIPSYLASDKKYITLAITDSYFKNSINGTSGIEKYDIIVKDNSSNEICKKEEKFNAFNTNGEKEESDSKIVKLECSNALKKAGTYTILINVYDFAGNHTKLKTTYNIYPNNNLTHSIIRNIDDNYNNKIGDFKEGYEYELTLIDEYDNVIKNKNIISINQGCDNCVTPKLDQTNENSESALNNFKDLKTDNSGKVIFELKSYAPGLFNETFNYKIKKWDNNYNNINEINNGKASINNGKINSFTNPFTGKLTVSNESDFKNEDFPILWKIQYYKLIIKALGSIKDYNLEDYKEKIKTKNIGHKIRDKSNLKNKNHNFELTIDANTEEGLKKAPQIIIDGIIINYTINGKKVRYKLTANSLIYNQDSNTNSENEYYNNHNIKTKIGEKVFEGIRIIGTLQGDGKQDLIGLEDNFSDISKSNLRKDIRKNAYNLIRNIKSGSINNNVLYINQESNLKISEVLDKNFETIIVKNTNLIIDKNINKNIGIIVLKDNYDVNKDYEKSGNIYISKNITNINALLYADGGLISSDGNGNVYKKDNLTRNKDLNKQLIINGTIFTRNTIGGSTLNPNLLPGGEKTEEHDKAMLYDLNYLRMGNDIVATVSREYDEKVIIKYNINLINNPPIGFVKK